MPRKSIPLLILVLLLTQMYPFEVQFGNFDRF